MVIDRKKVKVLAWYDNEWGYVNRMMELARKVGLSLEAAAASTDGRAGR
jgi:glyceraldehyde 3-phosphate dehydrogenase